MGFLGDLSKSVQSGLTGGVTGLLTGGIATLGSRIFGGNNDQQKAFEYQKQLQQMQNDWQAQQNQKAMDFQRQNWKEQFNLSNEYNNPSASVQRLISAGLNPAGALNNAGNTASTAQGLQGVANGSPVGSVGAPIASLSIDNRKAISEMIASMSGSARNTADASRTNKLANAELSNLIAKTNNEEAQSYFTQLQTKLTGMYGGRKMQAEINSLVAQMATSYADVQKKLAECKTMEQLQKVYKSEVDVNWSQSALNNAKVKLSKKEYDKLEIELKYYDAWMRDNIELLRARRSEALASAFEHSEGAKLKSSQEIFQSQLNSLQKIKLDLVHGKDSSADVELYKNSIRASIKQMIETNSLTESQRNNLDWVSEKLSKDVDYYELKLALEVVTAVASAVR
ncbi:MAG: DNA pilot protein [Microviridae sp.]|nr:MAG: DNA pilot protein [Microviridae sp.]